MTPFYAQINDLSISEFHGKIKTVDTYVNNKKQKSVEYNTDGNILNYVVGNNLNSGGNRQYFSKKYDKTGRKIYYTDAYLTNTIQYDDAKNSSLEYTLNALRKDTTYLYFKQFDTNKNLILNKSIEFSSNKRYLQRTTEYQYDTLNRLTSEVSTLKNILSQENTKSLKTYIKYSYSNDAIKKTASNDKGEEFVTENFKFPSYTPLYKNLFAYYSANNDGLTYDKKTESAKMVQYTNKEKSSKKVILFSKKELLLLEENYDKEKLILKTENKYNNSNNIIEKSITNYKTGKTEVTKYVITYYTK